MKITYIANLRMPTEKAYGIQITKMCEAFAFESEVELVVPTRKNFNEKSLFEYYGIKNNFRVRTLFSPDFYFTGRFDKISFLIKNFLSALILSIYVLFRKADIIFSRDELPLYFLSFFKNNLVFEAHKFSLNRLRFYRRFKKAGVKMITISSGLKDEFVNFGFGPDKILVAHDGVDIDQFNISLSREECRAKVGLPADKKIIGYVGQLSTMGMEKGIGNLIEAMVKLRTSYPNLILVIVGGSEEDIIRYKIIAEQKGLKNEVLFLGRKEHKTIPVHLKAFDVLVMPFPNQPHYALYMSPLKLFEYMASGQPIVATNLPTVTEVLNSNNSLLVRPDDSREFAQGIETLLKDVELSQRLSVQAINDVKNYTWNKRAEKILNFIE